MKKGAGESSLDRMLGKQGIITEEVNNLAATGEVQIDGQYWMARTADNVQPIQKGQVVTVLQVLGVRLIVEPVAKKNPVTPESAGNIED